MFLRYFLLLVLFFICSQKVSGCSSGFTKCPTSDKCIKFHWFCDRENDCGDFSDEQNCGQSTTTTSSPVTTTVPSAEEVLRRHIRDVSRKGTVWFRNRRKNTSGVDRWGDQLHRTATALFLSGEDMSSKIGQELAYELTIHLLSFMSTCREGAIPSEELALYINALQVSCLDPKNFYGRNLVSELRARVDAANYTNPFELLVLCTAGDTMSSRDLERARMVYDSQPRPFWIENQAMATMVVACLSSRSDVPVDERTLRDMILDLKKRQFRNGTVDNLRTTALVMQTLTASDSMDQNFNKSAAMKVLEMNQRDDGSFGTLLDTYYVLPALMGKSLVDISSEHCEKHSPTAEETLGSLLRWSDSRIHVQYSVWIRKDVVLGRTWRLMMKPGSSVYEVIETVNRLDTGHKVVYSVFDGKPYVSGLSGIQDDPEIGTYWFIFLRKKNSDESPVLKDESPVDIKLEPNQEIILWYRSAEWKDE